MNNEINIAIIGVGPSKAVATALLSYGHDCPILIIQEDSQIMPDIIDLMFEGPILDSEVLGKFVMPIEPRLLSVTEFNIPPKQKKGHRHKQWNRKAYFGRKK